MSEPTDVVEIPLSKLAVPGGQVRTVLPGSESAAELEASIRAHGLLSSLVVNPTKGKVEKYWVVAGTRRLKALKKIGPKDRLVPCRVLSVDGIVSSVDVGVAENTCRIPLHPYDQFEAFGRMSAEGSTSAEIAARFGLAESTVLRRLKESTVATEVKEAYRDGRINLEQLQGFTICGEDHARQVEVLERLEGGWYGNVKSLLTERRIRGDTPLAKVAGLDNYRAAGGKVSTDLFVEAYRNRDDETDEEIAIRGTYLEDRELVQELAAQNLEAEAEKIRGEGWKWVEVLEQEDDDRKWRWRKMKPSKGEDFSPKQIATGGAFVWASSTGISVRRGMVNPGDEKASESTAGAAGGEPGGNGRSEAFVEHLRNQRRNVVSEAMEAQPVQAMQLFMFELVRSVFGPKSGYWPKSMVVDLEPWDNDRRGDLDVPFLSTDVFEKVDVAEQFRAFLALDPDERMRFAAAAVARLLKPRLSTDEQGLISGDGQYIEDFIGSLGIDWVSAWRPTKANYFGKLKKVQLDALVQEVYGEGAMVEAQFEGMTKGKLCEFLEVDFGVGGSNHDARAWLPSGFTPRDPALAVKPVDDEPADDDIG